MIRLANELHVAILDPIVHHFHVVARAPFSHPIATRSSIFRSSRNALKNGRVGEAASLLGRPYSLSGIVVRGNRIGHSIGFPTANIRIPESYKLIPSEGVYVARFVFAGKSYNSMVSIGRRPTLESHGKLSIEAHVLDFNDDLYGAVVSVYLLEKLRDNIRFQDLDALKSQLQIDRQATMEFFKQQP